MNQPNCYQNKTIHFLLFVLPLALPILLAGCAANGGEPALAGPVLPWRTVRKVAEAAPGDQVALWTDGSKTVIAWPGEPALPGIRLVDINAPEQITNLALGRVPRQLHLFSADEGLLHMFWLDQTLPGETHLASALITTDGKIERGPEEVSNKPTAEYSAAAAPSGDVLTAWTTTDVASSLYIQLVDGAGSVHPSVHIAERANYPAVAIDAAGKFHVSWLESQTENLWTIQYLSFALNAVPDPDSVQNAPIGLIQLKTGAALEAYSLASDSAHIYCLWETITANQGDQVGGSGPMGSLGGLSFPVDDDKTVQTLKFEAPEIPQGASLRWLAVAGLPTQTLAVSVLANAWDGQTWRSSPALLPLTAEGAAALQPLFALDSAPNATLSKVTLAAEPGGTLAAAWLLLRVDGTAAVYYASTN